MDKTQPLNKATPAREPDFNDDEKRFVRQLMAQRGGIWPRSDRLVAVNEPLPATTVVPKSNGHIRAEAKLADAMANVQRLQQQVYDDERAFIARTPDSAAPAIFDPGYRYVPESAELLEGALALASAARYELAREESKWKRRWEANYRGEQPN